VKREDHVDRLTAKSPKLGRSSGRLISPPLACGDALIRNSAGGFAFRTSSPGTRSESNSSSDRFDVLSAERPFQERVVFQVDLPDCEVIAGTPPRIDSGPLSIGKSSQFVSGLPESHIKEFGTRLAQQRGPRVTRSGRSDASLSGFPEISRRSGAGLLRTPPPGYAAACRAW
jgi:hypothetical protein